jgi:N-acetylglucosamine kinase-like BadF-type ATPase
VAKFLGIDGGGTKTTCAIGDENSILATARAGGSNLVRLGEQTTRASLHEAIRRACAMAEVDPSAVSGACVGAAGAGRPEISARIKEIVTEVLRCKVQVVGDMEVALHAAFSSGAGVIAIAGTGSIVYGRDAQGTTARAGGWGYAISDEGSGQWIGRTALSRVLRARDEGEDPTLCAKILAAWHLRTVDELIPAANATPPPDFAALFPVVLGAESSDALARSVLSEAGSELASLARIVVRRLFPGAECSVPLAMAGGVFRQSALVRQVFYNRVRAEFAQVSVNPTVVEPVRGAVELARLAAGEHRQD